MGRQPRKTSVRPDQGSPFERRLRKDIRGKVLFDDFSRGRYSTDASIYQITPLGVVVPQTVDDLRIAVQIAAEHQVPVIARGGGTSQGGQPIGTGLIIDTSENLNRLVSVEWSAGRVSVEPGIVLDTLNRHLSAKGYFFPVDPSTANRATLGGMAGNNSAGARSIKYGLMADNVAGIDTTLADGSQEYFGERPAANPSEQSDRLARLTRTINRIYLREQDELGRVVPPVLRHVAGYNLHRLNSVPVNLAELLVGSEGTLGIFTKLELKIRPLPAHTCLAVCHFPALLDAMTMTQHIVSLGPSAVELVDRTLIQLALANPAFRNSVNRFLKGSPDALLLVEFAGDDPGANLRSIDRLDDLMKSSGFGANVIKVIEPDFQREVWSVRKAALNIVMSMIGDTKPVSFIEDCVVPLEHLAEYTTRLTEVFQRHGTTGTWYAHASVGCLHVRPALNLKDAADVGKMRRIAEEAHEVVRQFKGSHSGEHGDGIVRSEFIRSMLGPRITRAFEEVKDAFDPVGLLNPGKIVRPARMDDRNLFRYSPDYKTPAIETAYDWSLWGGLAGATEMCNNNGACRKSFDGVMCPSYRATSDETHTTRGRANTLRLALSGQLGRNALTSDQMYETMDLCVGCKACRRECPTGVDMARMKTEFLYQYRKRHPASLGDSLIAHLPRYAPFLARAPRLANLPTRIRPVMMVAERLTGISAKRRLPQWRPDIFRHERFSTDKPLRNQTLALFVDTFSRYFEPENVLAARRVLTAAGFDVIHVSSVDRERPLCCGRTYLNAGMMDHARTEASRTLTVLSSLTDQGIPIIGLEPSCILTCRDEFLAMFSDSRTKHVAANTFTFEEFLAKHGDGDRLSRRSRKIDTDVVVHGHCHQKAFGVADDLTTVLQWIPGLNVRAIQSSCCGMAGSFGYEAKHYDVSLKMAELELLPQIRSTGVDVLIAADGTSCREQIRHGTGRTALHTARILAETLEI